MNFKLRFQFGDTMIEVNTRYQWRRLRRLAEILQMLARPLHRELRTRYETEKAALIAKLGLPGTIDAQSTAILAGAPLVDCPVRENSYVASAN